jgi:hypothetical protein
MSETNRGQVLELGPIVFAPRKIHYLGTWTEYWWAIAEGRKTFELRERRDRDFQAADVLVLREIGPDRARYTGKELAMLVTYLLDGTGEFGLTPGHVCMGLLPVACRELGAEVGEHRAWIPQPGIIKRLLSLGDVHTVPAGPEN